MAGGLTIAMRAYFSSYHLWSAGHFGDLAEKIEAEHQGRSVFDIEHRAHVTASIFASAAFLESAVNEVLQDAEDQYHSYVSDLDLAAAIGPISKIARRDRWGTLRKYQGVLEAAGKEKFDDTAEPYWSALLALQLRNSLVHYRPATLTQGSTDPLPKLDGKFPLNRLMHATGNPLFPDKLLGAGAARWCLDVCRVFADAFFARLSLTPNYQRVEFSPPSRTPPAS